MAKVGAKLGLTMKLFRDSQFEFIRPEITIEGIDTEGDVKVQLEEAVKALQEVWETTTVQVNNLILSKMPQVNKEMELQISNKLKQLEKEISEIKKLIKEK